MSTLRSFCSSMFQTGESVANITTDTIGTLSAGLTYLNRETNEFMRQQEKRIAINRDVIDKEIIVGAAEKEQSLLKRISRLDKKLIQKYQL